MLFSILDLLLSIISAVLCFLPFFRDFVVLPSPEEGTVYRTVSRSAAERLSSAGFPFLVYVTLALAAVSAVFGVLTMFPIGEKLRTAAIIFFGLTVIAVAIVLLSAGTLSTRY